MSSLFDTYNLILKVAFYINNLQGKTQKLYFINIHSKYVYISGNWVNQWSVEDNHNKNT